MRICAHRGWWMKASEKNTLVAFRRALDAGFGFETDIRDFNGQLVISHDISDADCPLLEEVLRLVTLRDVSQPIALNIKADGLQVLLGDILRQFQLADVFVFDMSVPDALVYLTQRDATDRPLYKVFTRFSEYEPQPAFLQQADGVWLDGLKDLRLTSARIEHFAARKAVCVVSPELHGRDHLDAWETCKRAPSFMARGILCTDYPAKAEDYFK